MSRFENNARSYALWESKQDSFLRDSTDSSSILSASTALRNIKPLSTAIEAIATSCHKENQLNKQRCITSFLFPAIFLQLPSSWWAPPWRFVTAKSLTRRLARRTLLYVLRQRTIVAFAMKFMLHLCALSNVSLIENSALILSIKDLPLLQWTNCVKRGKMPYQRTTTQKPLHMKGEILFHIRLCDLYVQVWFGIVNHLEVNTLFGTFISNCFIRYIFFAERKFAQWRSPPVAIVGTTERAKRNHMFTYHNAAPTGN